MTTQSLIVGTKECSIHYVVRILSSSDSFALFFDKWMDVCIDLEIPSLKIKEWKRGVLLEVASLKYVLSEILHAWVGLKGSGASLEKFLNVLTSNGMKILTELLEKKLISVSHLPLTKKYCKIQQHLEEFFSATDINYAIISTLDSCITCDKIKENVKDVLIFNRDEFLKETSIIKNKSSSAIYVTQVDNVEDIEIVFDAAESSDSVHKLLIITEQPEVKIKNRFGKMLGILKDEMTWDQLTPIFKQEMRQRLETQIQFKSSKISKTVCGQVLVDLINNVQPKLFNNIPEELLVSYYIPRVIIKRNRLDKEKIFQNNSNEEIFLFTGLNKKELRDLLKNQMIESTSSLLYTNTIKPFRFIILDNTIHFLKICEKTTHAVHWIHSEEGEMHWIKSNKHINRIQEMLEDRFQEEKTLRAIKSGSHLKEEEFVNEVISNNDARVVCLSDSPGMGKSILLASIGKHLKKKHESTKFVLFARMSEIIALLKDNLHKSTLIFALHQLVCKNELEKDILSTRLSSLALEIELLLDGFDEVIHEHIPYAFKLLQFLQCEFNSIRIWVTTRPQHLQIMEQKLNTIGFNIQPFNEQDQIQFLTSFWKHNHPYLDLSNAMEFSKHCLKIFSTATTSTSNQPVGQTEIAGIPLQCLLLAEVYEESAINWCGGNRRENANREIRSCFIGGIDSIVTLYERLVEKKLKKLQQVSPEKILIDINRIHNMHAKIAFMVVYPHWFDEESFSIFEESAEIQELLHIGFLEQISTSENTPKFLHRTFAEYFCAKFVFRKLHQNDFQWEDYFKAFVYNYFFSVSKDYKDGERTYTFSNVVPCYFLNSLVSKYNMDEDISKIKLPSMQISLKNVKKIMEAISNCNFYALFGLFEQHPSFHEHAKDMFDEEFLLHLIRHQDVEMIRKSLLHFERYLKFTSRLKLDCLCAVVERNKVSQVEFFLTYKEFASFLYEKTTLDFHILLLHCIECTLKFSPSLLSSRIKILKLLLNDKPNVSHKIDQRVVSPVFDTIALPIRLELLNLNATVFATDANKDNILQQLVYSDLCKYYLGYSEMLPLSELEVVMNRKKSQAILAQAIQYKLNISRECLEKWIKHGMDVNEIYDGSPWFLRAIQRGYGESVLNVFIENGVNLSWTKPESIDENTKVEQKTYLDFAAESANYDAVCLLVNNHNFNVNGCQENLSPLDYLIIQWKLTIEFDLVMGQQHLKNSERYLSVARQLYRMGSRLKFTSIETLHQISLKLGDVNTLQFSFELGWEINKTRNDGNNLLHLFSPEGYCEEPIKFILDAGADKCIRNSDGLTPLDLAFISTPFASKPSFQQTRLLMPCENFMWSNVSPRVTSEHLASFLAHSVGEIGDSSEFLLLLKEIMSRRDSNKSRCLHMLFQRRNQLSPSQFHILSKYLILENFVKLLTLPNENGLSILQISMKTINGIERKTLNLFSSQQEIDFKIKDKMGNSLLFYAVKGGQSIELLELLSKFVGDFKETNTLGQTLLHAAVKSVQNGPATIKFLIEKGLNPNLMDKKDGNTPLHFCFILKKDENKRPSFELVRALLDGGAQPELRNKYGKGKTSFDLAVQLGSEFFCEQFYDRLSYCRLFWELKYSNINQPSLASLQLDIYTIGEFIQKYWRELTKEEFIYMFDLYLKRAEYSTADKRKHSKFINKLLYSCMPISDFNNRLHSSNFHLAVEYIIQQGYKHILNVSSIYDIAQRIRVKERTLQALLSCGIDLSLKDENGMSLLFHAMRGYDVTPKYLQMLHKYGGGNFKDVDKYGQNLLHYAVKRHNIKAVEFLLDKDNVGLDVNEMDYHGETPLDILLHDEVKFQTFLKTAKVLIEAGAKIKPKHFKEDSRNCLMNLEVYREWLIEISILNFD